MPRRADVLCAGTCGQLIWRGRGGLPPGQAMCRSCRRAKRLTQMRPALCERCGQRFESTWVSSTRGWRKTCSQDCRYAVCRAVRNDPKDGPCADCGETTTGCGRPLRCRKCAAERRRAIQRRHDSMRRGAKPSRSYPMTLGQLGARDGWRCHLCGKRVDRARLWPDVMCGTFDHLIPVVDGGSEEPENLALAHLSCNSKRGARGVVQLRLVG